MATLFIAEYNNLVVDGEPVPFGVEPSLYEQVVEIGPESAQSAPFSPSTKLVRVFTKAACHVAFGPDPVATSTTKPMGAGQTEYWFVRGGHRLAVVAGS